MSKQYEKLVGSVPARIVQQATLVLTSHDGKVAEYNVAAWLQLPGQAGRGMSLLARYRDGNALREAPIDHGRIDTSGRILLSGIARLPIRQAAEDLQIVLRSEIAIEVMIVDELFVQPAAPAEADRQRVPA